MRRLWLGLAVAVACAAQPVSVPGGRLKIIAHSPVVVRGQDRADAVFSPRSPSSSFSIKPVVKGAWTVVMASSPRHVAVEVSVPRSLAQVVVATQGGFVEVYDIQGSVNAETASGRVQMNRIGRDVRASTGGGPIRIGTVGGTLRCASGGGTIQIDRAGGETWCETAGGEIFIGEAGGPVHAATAGNVQIGRAGGPVTVRTEGGLVEVHEAQGRVIAQTSGGSIQVGPSKGVACESGAGAIRVKGVDGPLRAFTASGSILAELIPGARLDDSALGTDRGDITVFLPSNISVSVQAVNHLSGRRGRIVSDFPEIRVRGASGLEEMVTAEGALNGGGPVLRISAAGNIYLRRGK